MEMELRTPNLGTGVVEHRDRVSFSRLRQERRDRVFALMDDLDLDVCIFGREANAKYVSGARRLWLSHTRAFMPSCLVVRATREVHLMSSSTSFDGMPEELRPDDVYAISWDPAAMVDDLRAIPGVGDARTVGVDGLTPRFDEILRKAFAGASLVGVQPELTELRRVKIEPEVTCLRIAAATAEAALVAAIQELRPGVNGKALQGAYLERMCVLGTSQFAQQGTFSAVDEARGLQFLTDHRPIPEGTAVALAGGVLWLGYEGSLARTWWCGRDEPPARERSAFDRWRETTGTVVDACRPGTSGLELLDAFGRGGAEHAAVYSLGLGHEGAIAAGNLDPVTLAEQVLRPGMVLGVRSSATSSPGGRYYGEEMVLVTEGAPEVLTTLSHGPIAAAHG